MSPIERNNAIRRLKLELLKGKTWRYLRYIHARHALTMVTDWSSVAVEVLEHIEDAEKAAANMRKCANKYVFCLVPFAEEKVNSSLERRNHVFKKFEHYVVGYDRSTLKKLFPDPIAIRSCYWHDGGIPFRSRLNQMDVNEIKANYDELLDEADLDIRISTHEIMKEALGIWILSDIRS